MNGTLWVKPSLPNPGASPKRPLSTCRKVAQAEQPSSASLLPLRAQLMPQQRLKLMKGASLPPSLSFGSRPPVSEGTSKAHVDLSPAYKQFPSGISGCQPPLQSLPPAAKNLPREASEPLELTAPNLGVDGDRHRSRNHRHCPKVSSDSLGGTHSFFSFSTRLQVLGAELVSCCLHSAYSRMLARTRDSQQLK